LKPIRVLVVDDSDVVRRILVQGLETDPDIKVIAAVPDPFAARVVLESREIDVITLDVEMPRMDGLTFLKYLMKYQPLPVIMVSSLTDKASRATTDALILGAADAVLKPDPAQGTDELLDTLIEKVRACAQIDTARLQASPPPLRTVRPRLAPSPKLIAVGASTGGPQALEALFREFDPDFPPTLAVIHMPPRFTKAFANRLNDLLPVAIKEAEDQEPLQRGTIYIAPGDFHMTVRRTGGERFIRIQSAPKVWHQRPSVDVLFVSVAASEGKNSVGVLLTGMGRDGAEGLLAMREAGAYTVAQDESTSVVYGMPRAAVELEAAVAELPLPQIATNIRSHL
jgi:two-component system chemotaxis response regulator CheB